MLQRGIHNGQMCSLHDCLWPLTLLRRMFNNWPSICSVSVEDRLIYSPEMIIYYRLTRNVTWSSSSNISGDIDQSMFHNLPQHLFWERLLLKVDNKKWHVAMSQSVALDSHRDVTYYFKHIVNIWVAIFISKLCVTEGLPASHVSLNAAKHRWLGTCTTKVQS